MLFFLLTLLLLLVAVGYAEAGEISIIMVNPCCSQLMVVNTQNFDLLAPKTSMRLVDFKPRYSSRIQQVAVLVPSTYDASMLRRRLDYVQNSGAALAIVFGSHIPAIFSPMPTAMLSYNDGTFLSRVLDKYKNVTVRIRGININEQDDGNDTSLFETSTSSLNQYQAIGLACGLIFGLVLAYLIGYIAYRCCCAVERERGKRFVRRAKYIGSESTITTAPMQADDLALENIPQDAEETTAAIAQRDPLFEIVIVDSEDEIPALLAAAAVESTTATPTSITWCCCSCCSYVVEQPPRPSHSSSDTTMNSAPTLANAFDFGGTCTICLDDFENGQEVLLLPCRHIFHHACVWAWLNEHGNCPNCKQDLLQVKPPTNNDASNCPCTNKCLKLIFGYNILPTFLSLICFITFGLVITLTLTSTLSW